jgi:RNase P subunit RPR2
VVKPTVRCDDNFVAKIAESEVVLVAVRTCSDDEDKPRADGQVNSPPAKTVDASSDTSHSSMSPQTQTKMCRDCKVLKPRNEFSPRKVNGDGLDSYCRKCGNTRRAESRRKNLERHHEVQRAWRRRNVDKRQLYDLRQIAARYGIDEHQYFAMIESQSGACTICGTKQEGDGKRLSIDHDHRLGRVRGLLCSNCNLGIGYFYDNPTLLRRAAEYVTPYS